MLDELRAEELHRIQMKVGDCRRQLEANADAIRTADRTIGDLTEGIEELGDARGRLDSLPVPADDLSSAALVVASNQSQLNKQEAHNLATAGNTAEADRNKLRTLVSDLVARLERSLCVPNSRNSEAIQPLDEALGRVAKEVASLAAQIDGCLANSETLIRHTAEEILPLHKAQEAEYADLQERNHIAGTAIRERTAAQQAVASLETLERKRTAAQEQRRQSAGPTQGVEGRLPT